jgi:alpha-beta hydrolase superfamily lysophospholipase
LELRYALLRSGQDHGATLITSAEWDQVTYSDRARALFNRLTASPRKRFVEIGQATHLAMLEKNRMQLYREVQLFLEEGNPLV